MTAAACGCKGVISGHSALSPFGDTQILSCPIKMQGERIMWNWYTTEGRPVMFMEAAPQGAGVMLADYHNWLPGETGRPTDFELPKACAVPDHSAPAPAANATPTFSNVSCSDCHTTPW
jgi:hypothetical protein